MSLTSDQQEIKDEFIKIRGTWGPEWETILELDPEFMRAYLNFSAVPWKKNHLDDKTKELMTHNGRCRSHASLRAGGNEHIRAALKAGATKDEIMEVL